MNFNSVFWPDSTIIEIKYSDSCLKLIIFDMWSKKCFNVVCKEVCGLDNLSLWEDLTVEDAEWMAVIDKESELGRKLYGAYGCYGYMAEGLKKVQAIVIKLIDNSKFTVFCNEIEVTENERYSAKIKDDGFGSSL